MKNKTKPVSRQKKQANTVPKKSKFPKKVNKRKPVTAMFWKSSLDVVTDAVCFLDVDQRILHCNRAMTEMFGMTQKEIIGKHCWEIVHGTTKPFSKCPTTRAKKSLARENGEIRKGDRWFNIIADPIVDKKGKIKGVVHTLQDITEHKRTTRSLQESENKYRELVENVSEVIFSVDIQGLITYISPAMEHLTGYSAKEVIGTNITKHIIPEDLPDVLASINRILASGQNEAVEYRIKIKNGGIRYVVSSSNVFLKDGQPAGLTGVITDITMRKQAEESLKEAELKLRTIFDSASDGILLAEAVNRNFISTNEKICAMLGYTKEELLKLNISDIHPKEFIPYVIDQFEKLAREEIAIAHDIPVMRKDKTLFFADVNSSLIILEGKECLMGIFRDVTERKQLEKALKERDTLFKKLSANIPGIIYQFMMKPDGTFCIPFSTDGVKEIFGCSSEDIINDFSPIAKVVHPEDVERFMDSIKLSAENISQWQCEYRVQVPFKPLRWLLGTSTPEKLPDGSIIWHGFNTDITERKQAQEILQQKNEMLARTEKIANIGSWEWDIKGDKVRWSDELFRIFQRDPSLGAPSFAEHSAIYFAQDIELLRQAVERCVADGTPYELELRGIRADGEIRYCIARGLPHTDSAGKIYQLYGSLQDITERKRTEEALRKNELMFRSLFENNPVGVFLITDRTFVRVNPALCNITGYSPEELIGQSVRICYASDEEYERAGSILYEQVTKKGIGSVEALCKRKNGEIFHGLLFLNQIDPLDASFGYEGIMVDITERKQADEALKRSGEDFRSLFEQSLDGIIIIDQSGIIMANHAFSVMSGYPVEKIIGKNPLDFIHPDDRETAAQRLEQRRKGEQSPEGYIYRAIRADGSISIVDLRSKLIEWKGKPAFQTMIRDITKQRQAEDALRASEEKYRGIFDESINTVYVFDTKKTFIDSNQAGLDLLGYPREELMKMSIPDVDADPVVVLPAHQELYDGGRLVNYEHKLRRKDGSIITVLNNSKPLTDSQGNTIGMLSTLIDITERKKAEETLKQSQLLNEAILNSVPGLLYMYDDTGHLVHWNKQHEDLTGYSGEEIKGRYILDWFGGVEPDTSIIKNGISDVLTKGYGTAEAHLLTKDGNSIFMSFTGVKLNISGRDHLLGIGTDITERKKAEEERQKEFVRLQTMVSNAPVVIFAVDKHGIFTLSEGKALSMMGLKGGEVVGQSFLDVYRDHPEDQEHFRRALKGEAFTTLVSASDHFFEAYHEPVFTADGKFDGSSGILVDITERKKTEKELEKYREHLEELVRERTINLEASNKELEAFSYSASHDLRAPLRSIEGFSQALLEDYEDKLDIQGKDYLTRIKTATRRMADLIEDMLQLSRITRMEMNIEKVNLTLIARSVMSELQKSQPQRHVEISIADRLEDTADLRLMRIVMDNLLSNSWKFTEKQANATIEFGLLKTEGSRKVYFIRDNGAGFDMAYADKLFAPFQRLHADDEFPGTGIGLATVRRILNRHGGRIWADGEIGKGATFYFSLN